MPVKRPAPGELEPIETASRDELQALQLQRLKWSLRHAYENVPHYKRAFDAKGVHPDDLKSLADLSKFPFTTKKELRENYPFGMFAVPRQQVVRVHASSGTTGKPTVVGYTQGDIARWADLVARSIRASMNSWRRRSYLRHSARSSHKRVTRSISPPPSTREGWARRLCRPNIGTSSPKSHAPPKSSV